MPPSTTVLDLSLRTSLTLPFAVALPRSRASRSHMPRPPVQSAAFRPQALESFRAPRDDLCVCFSHLLRHGVRLPGGGGPRGGAGHGRRRRRRAAVAGGAAVALSRRSLPGRPGVRPPDRGLRTLPIYVVGAALAASLAVTAVVASRVLRVRLSRVEWTAVAVVCAGLAMLALASAGGPPGGPGGAGLGAPGRRVRDPAARRGGRPPAGPPARARPGPGRGPRLRVVEVAVRLIDGIDLADPALYASWRAAGRPSSS